MGSQFKRLKKYNAMWDVIRAILAAAAMTLLLAGVLLLLQKLRIFDAGLLTFVAPVVAGVVTAVVTMLLLRRSDLRLAEVIDGEHKLRERVQTMIAYRNEDSAMLQMQREDTENRLAAVKRAGVKPASVGMQIVALVLAFAIFATGLIMPVKAVDTNPSQSTAPTEADYVASEFQKAALDALIKHVDESQAVDSLKTPMVASLTELRAMLDVPTKVSVVRATVINNMTQAFALADEANSQDDMHKVLSMMSHKVKAYLSYCLGNLLLDDFDEKMDMAETILKSDTAAATSIAAEVAVVLKYSEFDNTDALYAAVVAFGLKMAEAGVASDANDLVGTRNLIGEAVYDLRSNAALALQQQWLTKEEAMYTVMTLAEIFAISDKEIPGDPDQEYALDTSEPPPEVEGSQGTGEMQYPSDDKVYDYKNNEHVIYHQIMDEYYKAMTNDAMDGKFSDEVEAFLRKYFGNLQTDNDEE